MDKIEELLKARNDAEAQIESRKKHVTILFTDIRGSTSFFSMEGDVEGMAMIHRHNTLLFPLIKKYRGRIVKTIGDAIHLGKIGVSPVLLQDVQIFFETDEDAVSGVPITGHFCGRQIQPQRLGGVFGGK